MENPLTNNMTCTYMCMRMRMHMWRLLALLVHGGGANLNSRGRHFQRTTRALGMSV